jgi:uncharacterized protein involved in outer membrane biogenesis
VRSWLARARWARMLLFVGVAVVALLTAAGLALPRLANSDAVRRALQSQATAALGIPVAVGAARVAIFPRIALRLERVTVGEPPQVSVGRVVVATGLGGLVRRRVEDAELRLEKARVRLPLALSGAPAEAGPAPRPPPAPRPAPASTGPALVVASVRSIVVDGLELEAGGRTARVDLDGTIEGERFEVRRLALRADRTELTGTARLANWRAIEGTFAVEATTLELDGLLAFVSALASPAPAPRAPSRPAAAPSAERATPAVTAPPASSPARPPAPLAGRLEGTLRAAMGSYQGIAFRDLAGALRIEGHDVSLAPVSVRLLGGRYDGTVSLKVSPTAVQVVHEGKLRDVDLAEVSKTFGAPGSATGTLALDLTVAGAGPTLDAAVRSAVGTGAARGLDVEVQRLDLLHTALAYLGGGMSEAAKPTPPAQLAATLAVGDERLTTRDLRLDSPDFAGRGRGALTFRGALDVAADVFLSEALSSRVRGDVAKYAKEGGRVALPMKVGGSVTRPSVSIDVAALAGRAAGSAGGEATKKLGEKLEKELSKRLFPRSR